jgi:predicted dienelactone hydrolase
VPNSWHFDFLPACNPELAQLSANSDSPDACAGASGFDRDAFHHQFDAAILAFFQKHLAAAVSASQ